MASKGQACVASPTSWPPTLGCLLGAPNSEDISVGNTGFLLEGQLTEKLSGAKSAGVGEGVREQAWVLDGCLSAPGSSQLIFHFTECHFNP